MAVQGAYTIFNLAKIKVMNGGGNAINLAADTVKCVLCNSSQALSATFAGASTNAQYSDLTGELATADGYTAGGITVTSTTLTLAAGVVTFGAGNPSWTLTGAGITFKYAVFYDNTLGTHDLICFVDMDTSGGSVSPIAGTLTIQTNAAGINTWT